MEQGEEPAVVEIFGVEDGEADEPQTRGPSGLAGSMPKPALVAAILVAAVVVAGLAFLPTGADDDESAVARPDRTSAPAAAPVEATAPRGGVSQLIGAPLLHEPVEMFIAIGGTHSELRIVDLDSGEMHWLGRNAEPRLAIDGWLVTRNSLSRWEILRLDDPRAEPRPAPEGAVFSAAVAAEDGGVWFRRTSRAGRQKWYRVDLASGDVLEQVIAPIDSYVPEGPSGRPLAGPEIVGARSGGVYRLGADGGFQRAADGRLIAYSDELVLVATCDARLDCESRWVDRTSFEAVDLRGPTAPLGSGFILDSDAMLVAETVAEDRPVVKLFDVETGAAIAISDPRDIDEAWVSPTGRFLARRGWDRLLISDVERGRTFSISALDVNVAGDEHVVWGQDPTS